MDNITDIRVGETPAAILKDGTMVLGRKARIELASRQDDTALPGLSLAAYEKLKPFLWIARKEGDFYEYPDWSPSIPTKKEYHPWRNLTYAEVDGHNKRLLASRGPNPLGVNSARTFIEPAISLIGQRASTLNWHDTNNWNAQEYLNRKAASRRRMRNWFGARWNEVLAALSPQG